MNLNSKWFDGVRMTEAAAPRVRSTRARYHRRPGAGTPSQDAVLAFINANDPHPSPEEIREHMGWKKLESAKQCLRNMRVRGVLPASYDLNEMLK